MESEDLFASIPETEDPIQGSEDIFGNETQFRPENNGEGLVETQFQVTTNDEIDEDFETQYEPQLTEINGTEQSEIGEPLETVLEENHTERLIRLPLSRIKQIMKADPDVNITSQEAVFVVAKATELFIESLARETYAFTVRNKKKTIQRRDLDAAIEATDALCFLEGTLD